MTTEPANPRISGRARFLLLVMTFVVPVMAAALDPGAAAATSFTTLFAFPGGSNGADPFAAVTQGPDGALYGTTQLGGGGLCNGTCGTIFQLTPPHPADHAMALDLAQQLRWQQLRGRRRFPGGRTGTRPGRLALCGTNGSRPLFLRLLR